MSEADARLLLRRNSLFLPVLLASVALAFGVSMAALGYVLANKVAGFFGTGVVTAGAWTLRRWARWPAEVVCDRERREIRFSGVPGWRTPPIPFARIASVEVVTASRVVDSREASTDSKGVVDVQASSRIAELHAVCVATSDGRQTELFASDLRAFCRA